MGSIYYVLYDGLDVGFEAELMPSVCHVSIWLGYQVMSFQRHEGLD